MEPVTSRDRQGSRPAAGLLILLASLLVAAPAQAASGIFDRTWGFDVDQSGPPGGAVEVCKTAVDCKEGAPLGDGGGYDEPADVAIDSSGNIYVADLDGDRIQKLNPGGDFLRAWGMNVDEAAAAGFEICTVATSCQFGNAAGGPLGGEMNDPRGVAVDGVGNVYVAESPSHRIQKFDSSGNFLRAWGKDVIAPGPGDTGVGFEICTVAANCKLGVPTTGPGGEFNSPRDVATDSIGNVYVADRFGNRIQKFDSNGNFLRMWGDGVDGALAGTGFENCTVATSCLTGLGGDDGGHMFFPEGVAVSGGDVYVADTSNSRMQKFDTSGGWQRAWGKNVDDFGGAGFEICVIAANCKAGGSGPAIGGAMSLPVGVAVDPSGAVYVADLLHRIQKFDSSGNWLLAWGRDVVDGGISGFEICAVAASCKEGTTGTPALGGYLNLPWGLATDPLGAVYVADRLNYRIQKFVDPPVTPPTNPAAPTPIQTAPKKKCKKGQKLKQGKCVKKKRKRRN